MYIIAAAAKENKGRDGRILGASEDWQAA